MANTRYSYAVARKNWIETVQGLCTRVAGYRTEWAAFDDGEGAFTVVSNAGVLSERRHMLHPGQHWPDLLRVSPFTN